MKIFNICLVAAIMLAGLATYCQAENWPAWRGPRGDGSSDEKDIPTKWNGETGENIAWKTRINGVGHSSPIVHGDRVFLTTCDLKSEERLLICIDRKSGEILWQRAVFKSPLEKKHNLNSFASGTPATDGELVYCTFLDPDFGSKTKRTPGDMVVAAYDYAGNEKWTVRPGRFASVHGYCSSPILFEDLLIVNGDHDGDGYMVALNRKTGKQTWRIDRPNKTRSYCTPVIFDIGGRTQMILSGSKCITSYDPGTGDLHWMIRGPTEQYVASLVYNGDLLFMTAGFPERHMLAIDPTGSGDVTDTHVRWRTTKSTSYVPSPIAIGDYFLVVSDNGIGSCFEADSGERLWMERLGPHFSGSLVTANGLAYFISDKGVTTIVRPGEKLDVVAENPLGENSYASPAISQGQVFIRGEEHLFCIGKSK